MPKYESQEEALKEVESWRLGIKASPMKFMLIPKDVVIGIKRWGTLDYLAIKFNWLIRRER